MFPEHRRMFTVCNHKTAPRTDVFCGAVSNGIRLNGIGFRVKRILANLHHSGNIQHHTGNIQHHSGNIQDPFKSSSRSGARGPPPQLQEALEESNKVDAEYNLPTWVPKTRVYLIKRRIPGVDFHSAPFFRAHSGSIEGTYGLQESHLLARLLQGTFGTHLLALRAKNALRWPTVPKIPDCHRLVFGVWMWDLSAKRFSLFCFPIKLCR
jgi:hypothetical protein